MSNSHLINSMQIAEHLVVAFGGPKNINSLDACMTRLRVEVKSLDAVNLKSIKELGAKGLIIKDNEIQAIFGRDSDTLRVNIEFWLRKIPESIKIKDIIVAFGSKKNIISVDACMTRLRVSVVDSTLVMHDKLMQLGAMKVQQEANNIQVIFGKKSDVIRAQIINYLAIQTN